MEKHYNEEQKNLRSSMDLLSNFEKVSFFALLCTSVLLWFFCWFKTSGLIHLYLLSAIQNTGVYYHKTLWDVKTPDIELKLSEIICEQFPVSHSQFPRGKKKSQKMLLNKVLCHKRLFREFDLPYNITPKEIRI